MPIDCQMHYDNALYVGSGETNCMMKTILKSKNSSRNNQSTCQGIKTDSAHLTLQASANG